MKQTALVLSLLTSGAAGPMAQAQSVIFTNPFQPTRSYGLINTGAISLYINDRGDIGSPVRSGGAKPNGLLDASGRPYINADGSVNTNANNNGTPNGTYGLLVSQQPAPSGGSLGDSVRAKSEYLTVGSSTTAEGFAVFGDNSRLQKGSNWLNANDFKVNSFTTLSSGDGGLVSQLFRQTGAQATQGLSITQTVRPITSLNRVDFNIHFTNNDAQTLTGLRYARGINANPGGSIPNASTGDTHQFFGGPSVDNAFGIGSSIGSRQVMLSIIPGSPNATGARVTVASTHEEGRLLSNPDLFFDPLNSAFVTLGTTALKPLSATFNVGDGNGTTQTTNNFSAPALSENFNPDFGTLDDGDYSLLLESGLFNLTAGQSADFTFSLAARPQNFSAGVPEPGAFALFAGLLSAGLLLRRRSR